MKRPALTRRKRIQQWLGRRFSAPAIPWRRWAAFSGIVALLAGAVPVRATDYFWISPLGGPFSASPLWTPFNPLAGQLGPGGATDTVNFDLGAPLAIPYDVTGAVGQNDLDVKAAAFAARKKKAAHSSWTAGWLVRRSYALLVCGCSLNSGFLPCTISSVIT
jgi:hypothetical protein